MLYVIDEKVRGRWCAGERLWASKRTAIGMARLRGQDTGLAVRVRAVRVETAPKGVVWGDDS